MPSLAGFGGYITTRFVHNTANLTTLSTIGPYPKTARGGAGGDVDCRGGEPLYVMTSMSSGMIKQAGESIFARVGLVDLQCHSNDKIFSRIL